MSSNNTISQPFLAGSLAILVVWDVSLHPGYLDDHAFYWALVLLAFAALNAWHVINDTTSIKFTYLWMMLASTLVMMFVIDGTVFSLNPSRFKELLLPAWEWAFLVYKWVLTFTVAALFLGADKFNK